MIGRPELLAPAGDWEAMRAAVANGADAVYFGLEQFNARHRAANFKLAELPEVMAFLHGHNVKGFVTFNTLIFSEELCAAADYLQAIAEARVDAVIVQDLGIAKLCRQLCPSVAVHGSTQMTLTESFGIEFVRALGVERVVLARELGQREIGKIAQATTMPLEVFVHGALCVSYSGQCLTSESLGGRSANRGQCAQACRLPYELIVDGAVKDLGDKAYLLSPSDLAAHDLIGNLAEMGVASFKIEGRLKSAHYVAATTQTYRAAIDAARKKETFEISQGQKHDLEQTFSRGFTHGFLDGVNHQQLVSARFPKARGTRVGTVSGKTPRGVRVVLEAPESARLLKPGDGIVFDEGHPEQDEQGGRVFAVRPVREPGGACRLDIDFRAGDVNLAYINAGAIVWKTDDPAIKKRLEHSFSREIVARRVEVDFVLTARVGERLELRGRCAEEGREEIARWEEKPVEAATKFPVTQAAAVEQLARLGDTPFELGDVRLETDGNAMVPKSVLNELRRRVCAALIQGRQQRVEISEHDVLGEMRAQCGKGKKDAEALEQTGPRLFVLARTMEQLEAVIAPRDADGPMRPAMVYVEFEDVRRYGEAVEKCRAAGMPVALATLRIVKPGEEGFLKQISDCRPDAILVRSLAAIGYYRARVPEMPLIGDYSLNIANELTAQIFWEAGVRRMVPSYDLNWTQLGAMIRGFDAGCFECVVHQHMPMFHMEHCVFAATLSKGRDFRDCGRPCEQHRVDLRDRKGEDHALLPDVGCRNTVFNAQAQSAAEYIPQMRQLGIQNFRVEFLRENAEESQRIMDRYLGILMGMEKPVEALRRLRVLSQLGVTRGTLARE